MNKTVNGDKINIYLLYWYFQQNECLSIKKHVIHNIHRLAWGLYIRGALGNCPVFPCIKTVLDWTSGFEASTNVLLQRHLGKILLDLRPKILDILIEFPTWCLHFVPCSTTVYFASLNLKQRVPGDRRHKKDRFIRTLS